MGDLNDILEDLATSIGRKNLRKVGLNLGVPAAKLDDYAETNHAGGIVSSQGTLEMLKDTLKDIREEEKISSLESALIKSKLAGIADEYFGPDSKFMKARQKKGATSLVAEDEDASASEIRQSESKITAGRKVEQASIVGQDAISERVTGIHQSGSSIVFHGDVVGSSIFGQRATSGGSPFQDEGSGRRRKQGGGESAKNNEKGMSEPRMTVLKTCVKIFLSLIFTALASIGKEHIPWLSDNYWAYLITGILGMAVLWIVW